MLDYKVKIGLLNIFASLVLNSKDLVYEKKDELTTKFENLYLSSN
jgi:hypothetical protein